MVRCRRRWRLRRRRWGRLPRATLSVIRGLWVRLSLGRAGRCRRWDLLRCVPRYRLMFGGRRMMLRRSCRWSWSCMVGLACRRVILWSMLLLLTVWVILRLLSYECVGNRMDSCTLGTRHRSWMWFTLICRRLGRCLALLFTASMIRLRVIKLMGTGRRRLRLG